MPYCGLKVHYLVRAELLFSGGHVSRALMDTRPATAPVLIAYMSYVLGRHAADMKLHRKVPLWMDIMGV